MIYKISVTTHFKMFSQMARGPEKADDIREYSKFGDFDTHPAA
jgi:hypothetical protein